MKSLLMVSVLLLVGRLASQEQKKPEEEQASVQKVFILKYADPAKLSQLLAIFNARFTNNPDLHALAVRAPAEIMPAIEEAIKRLDTPVAATQNIELTAYYLIAGEVENSIGAPPPKELDSVITQLKNSFTFKSYRLLDVLSLRTRTGRGADTSSNPGPVSPGLPAATIQLHTGAVNLSPDGSSVSLAGMKAGVRMPVALGSALVPGAAAPNIPTQFTYLDLGLNADIDIKEGQKVVVGRLSVNKDQALFLVLTARIVN